jgi:hypothetical protein
MLGGLFKMLFFFRCSSVAIIALTLLHNLYITFKSPQKYECHSYFRMRNLVILSAHEVSSKKHYANSYSHFKCLMFVPCIIR